MKLIFKERFNKEAKLISSERVRRAALEIIDAAETVSHPLEISGSKALRYYPGCYRFRIDGEFRIVAYFNGRDSLTFISILHRRDAYKELHFLKR